MATTGKVKGTLMLLYVDGVAISGTTSHSMSNAVNMMDATTKDSGGKEEVLPGLRTDSIGFDYLVAFDATYDITLLFALIKNKTKVTLKLGTEVVGDPRYTGSAYLESLETTMGNEANVSGSGTFHVTAGLSEQTVT